MRTTALVLAGIIGSATAHAQNVYLPMLQFGQQVQQMQPLYQMQSPIQIYSAKQQLAQMRQDNQSMPSLVESQSRPRPVKILDNSERMAPVPTFSPRPGSYQGAVLVTIAQPTPGATIYYTLDGSQPQWGSAQYTGPIKVARSAHLVAIVVPPHGLRSPTVDGQYDISTAMVAAADRQYEIR
jgi:chitobiase/beta-hexosaminidase-like protein